MAVFNVKDAYRRRADLALGYGSWNEFAEVELAGDDPLTADVRRELVGMLSADGMSTRAIAPVAGVSQMQASRDVREVKHHVSPASPATPPEPAATVGLDGKTYKRPVAIQAGRRSHQYEQKDSEEMTAPSTEKEDKPRGLYRGPRGSARYNAEALDRSVDMLHGICTGLDSVNDVSALTEEGPPHVCGGWPITIDDFTGEGRSSKGSPAPTRAMRGRCRSPQGVEKLDPIAYLRGEDVTPEGHHRRLHC